LKIGVISVQGAVPEHLKAVNNALQTLGLDGESVPIRRPIQLDDIDALIIPGGESTTISKLIRKFQLFDKIISLATQNKIPIMGTCAGCILLAQKETREEEIEVELLGLMEMSVIRNAFGRQRESFENDIDFNSFDDKFHAVFIRAPMITKVWGNCRALARLEDEDDHIIAAQQDNLLALAFHPELTQDTRVHEYLIEMI
jgi:5'-phosphate synthase pdxT subunit